MKIKIKSLDKFKENYEKLFELEKIINLEEKKEYHYKDEYGNCKIIDKTKEQATKPALLFYQHFSRII